MKGEAKCHLYLQSKLVCKPHKSMKGHQSNLMEKQSRADLNCEGEQVQRSLPNIVDISESANDLNKDVHMRRVQSSLNIDLLPSFSNFESDINAHSDGEDVYSDFDLVNQHGHIGIDLTENTHNSIGILYNFNSTNSKTMLRTPWRGTRSFLILDGVELLHVEVSHQLVLDATGPVTFIDCTQLCNFPWHCNRNVVAF